MKPTRQRLIEYLQHRQSASAVEISRALHLTAADIRHHLSILESEGVVEVVGQRLESGRGRPTSLYQLTRQTFLNNLNGLSKVLLEEVRQRIPDYERETFYRRLAKGMIGNNFQPVRNPSQRFVNAIHHLNQMNYQARWEARIDAPQVIFSHCPYITLLPEYPEICNLDAALLERLVGPPFSQTARLQANPLGLIQCIFRVNKKFESTKPT